MKRDVHAVSADGYDLSRAMMHKSRDEKASFLHEQAAFCLLRCNSTATARALVSRRLLSNTERVF